MSYFLNLKGLASKFIFGRSARRPTTNKGKGINRGSAGPFHATRPIFGHMNHDFAAGQKPMAELNDNLLNDIGLSRESLAYLLRENDRIHASQNHEV
jgi:hypothetical protein